MAVSCTTPTRWSTLYGSSGGVRWSTLYGCKLYYIGGVCCMAVVVEYVVWL